METFTVGIISTQPSILPPTHFPVISSRHGKLQPRSRSREACRSRTRSQSPSRLRRSPHRISARYMAQTADWQRPARFAVPRRRRAAGLPKQSFLYLLFASPLVAAHCISLKGSTTCSAFQSASVSTNRSSTGFYSFLSFVSDVTTFDQQLQSWIHDGHVQEIYQERFGCQNINLSDTKQLYARYATTAACNSIIQNSISDCGLSEEQAPPVCAETCAEYAESLALITSDTALCSNPNSGIGSLIRAEFTTCALPVKSLSSLSCVPGAANEPENCGFDSSTVGLCSYCSSLGINSTDTCCYTSNAQQNCDGVQLPTFFPTINFTSPTSTATSSVPPSASPSASVLPTNGTNGTNSTNITNSSTGSRIGGGAIAGIVIGSLAALVLLAALIICCRRLRRRSSSHDGSILNQPSPPRTGPVMSQSRQPVAPQGYEVLPGGRIARMSALEGHSGDSPSRHDSSAASVNPATAVGGAGATAAAAAALSGAGRRRAADHSSSDGLGDSPELESRTGVLRPPPHVAVRRNNSQSSHSARDPQSPSSAGAMSSPHDVASQMSQQLPFFRDYYSQDDIRPGDRVAVLWAYQPRAADEFALERGDMLKVVGIWDDGWATGIMLDERADEWESRRQAQRDSGVSNTSGRRDTSPAVSGEIKAFPLVCVCLPEHWRKTIEGDGSTETGSSGRQGARSTFS